MTTPSAFDVRLGAFIRAQRRNRNARTLRDAMAPPAAPAPIRSIPIAPCTGCGPAERPATCPGRCIPTPTPTTH